MSGSDHSSGQIDLSALVNDPSGIEAVPASQIPALLARLSSLQTAIAARLMVTGEKTVETDNMLTIEQAAERLGVSADWIYRRSKKLPFIVRLGRNVRCSARELDRFLRNRVGR